MSNYFKEVIRLIDRLYKDLYRSYEVMHYGNGNVYDKFKNIALYLDKLEIIHNRVLNRRRHIEYLKSSFHSRYVIKREDIQQSYYDRYVKRHLDKGLGYIEVTESLKKQLQSEIIKKQEISLDYWIDYLISDEVSNYPFWVKYWAFQGMLRLGSYDKEKETFFKRTKHTVEPFAGLNEEALLKSFNLIMKLVNKENLEDEELNNLVKSGSFQKIYSYMVTLTLKGNKNSGIWIKYDIGSDSKPLVNSLRGYNTTWCIDSDLTANLYLKEGNIYIYYTLNDSNEYKIPRIAIRMKGDKILEICGILNKQELEEEMKQVVYEKIKDFIDKDNYYKRVQDMDKLTIIYNKYKVQKLTSEELRFLYEIDNIILGLDGKRDERVQEIIKNRDSIKKDLSMVLECSEDEIALNQNELAKNTIYYEGDLDYSKFNNIDNIILPKILKGNLDLSGFSSIDGLKLPDIIYGDLNLDGLKNIDGLKLPKRIDGCLYLRGLDQAKGLDLSKYSGKSICLNNLKDAEGLILPRSIDGNLVLNRLKNPNGLILPNSIGGNLDLDGLESVEGLSFSNIYVGGSLYLSSLQKATTLVLPRNIGRDLNLFGLKSVENLVLPQTVGGDLNLMCLENVKNLILPQSVGGNLDLGMLKYVDNLVLPLSVDGNVYLNNFESVENIIIPDNLTYTIFIKGISITPENVDGYRNNIENKRRKM